MPIYNLEKESIQHQFFRSRAKLQIFGGGFGNGKTTALVIKTLQIARDYPGSNLLLARATFPKLNDTLRKVFMLWCPEESIRRRPTQEDNTCYLVNGTAVNFRYVAQRGKGDGAGNTTSNLLSATFDFIGVDQVEDPEITQKDFLDLLGRLRGNTTYRPEEGEDDPTMPSTGPRMIALTCNPTHNWVYKELVQPYILWRDKGVRSDKLIVDADTKLPIMELFEGSTYTNASNLPPDFIKTQESAYKGQMRDRFLLGKWAAFEGLVHPDFDEHRNVLSRAQMESHMLQCRQDHVKLQVIEGYDFGLVSPSCYLFGYIDNHGRVFILDGFYVPEFVYHKQPQAIQSIRSKYLAYLKVEEKINADPDMFRRKVVSGETVRADTLARLFSEAGVDMRPASNEIVAGIAKVNAYIIGREEVPHVITGERPGPMLYVNQELEWFMDEVYGYYWKRNPQGQYIDMPIDSKDHAMNTAKYLLSSLPEPSDIVLPKDKLPPKWRFWHELSDDDIARQRA